MKLLLQSSYFVILFLLASCSSNGEINGFGWFGIVILLIAVGSFLYNQVPSVRYKRIEREVVVENKLNEFQNKYEKSKSDADVTKTIFGANTGWHNEYQRKFVSFYEDTSRIVFVSGAMDNDIQYSQIRSAEIKVDNETTYEKSGVGRAVVGSILAGSTGAIVGAATGNSKKRDTINTIDIVLKLNDINKPSFIFSCFDINDYFGVDKSWKQNHANTAFKSAADIVDIIAIILDRDTKSLS